MKVHGVEITSAQLDACLQSMTGSFTAAEVMATAIAAGVVEAVVPPGGYKAELVAMRVVDRLLQQQRRAGRIAFRAGRWQSLA